MAGRHEAGKYVAGFLVGAAAGAAVAYFYATQRGARRRARIAGAVGRLAVDVDEARRLWRRLNDAWGRFDRSRTPAAVPTARTRPPDGAA